MAIDPPDLLDAAGRSLRRPVSYFDHSTLVDAFEGKRGEGDNAAINARLAEIVEEAASKGTICLSVGHMIELSQKRREGALAMAAWLDTLEPLWFQIDDAAEDELVAEVIRRRGLKEAHAPHRPIHHAMTAALTTSLKDVNQKVVRDILRAPNIAGAMRDACGNLNERARQSSDFMIGLVRRTYEDRASIPPGTTPDEVVARTARNLFIQLQIDARNMIARTALEDYPSDLEVTDAVRAALDDRHALPLTKVSYHLLGRVADGVTGQDPKSRSFEARYGSFLWDTRHALAGAVVDVFTCDKYVDGLMSDFRTSRGMEPQVSLRGGRDREWLVAELNRQCDKWLG